MTDRSEYKAKPDPELVAAISEQIEQIRRENPDLQQSYRSTFMATPHGAVSVINKMANGDGTDSVFFVTASWTIGGPRLSVTVDRFIDSHERYWAEQLANRETAIVIAGVHYRVGSDKGPHAGYGGRRFRIRNIATGEERETHDLWYQGTIPPMFRDALPNTHEFVK